MAQAPTQIWNGEKFLQFEQTLEELSAQKMS